jgi:hypothetical protein
MPAHGLACDHDGHTGMIVVMNAAVTKDSVPKCGRRASHREYDALGGRLGMSRSVARAVNDRSPGNGAMGMGMDYSIRPLTPS